MTSSIIRWRPQRDLVRTHFGRLIDEAFNDFLSPLRLTGEEEAATGSWMPAVDIKESDDALTLTVELPGLKKDDLNIALEDRVLTIGGERKFEKKTEGETFHRIERAYGTFSRSFSLPSNVATDKVEASFKDGLLTVSLPKVEEARPRKISIK